MVKIYLESLVPQLHKRLTPPNLSISRDVLDIREKDRDERGPNDAPADLIYKGYRISFKLTEDYKGRFHIETEIMPERNQMRGLVKGDLERIMGLKPSEEEVPKFTSSKKKDYERQIGPAEIDDSDGFIKIRYPLKGSSGDNGFEALWFKMKPVFYAIQNSR